MGYRIWLRGATGGDRVLDGTWNRPLAALVAEGDIYPGAPMRIYALDAEPGPCPHQPACGPGQCRSYTFSHIEPYSVEG